MDFNILEQGGEIPVADLMALNGMLQKSATAGYQNPSSGGGSLGPLMPQSIQNTLDSATFTMEQVKFWQQLIKEPISQTMHEFTRVDSHGDPLSPYIPEGGGGTVQTSRYTKSSVQVKYLADRRQVSDVGTMVGLIGPNPQALAEETERGTLSLLGKLERELFYGDSDANALAFDGVVKQIKAGGNTSDLRGAVPTPNDLQRVLGALFSAPRYGTPDTIYVEPRVHASLIEYSNQFGRHEQVRRENGVLTYGHDQIMITGPGGAVPVKAAPFMHRGELVPAAATAYGGTDKPVISGAATQTAVAGASVTSNFVAADNGTYIYSWIGVNTATDGGNSARLDIAGVAVVAGDGVTLEISNETGVVYWKLYRSPVGGTADQARFIGDFAINVLGGAGTTQIIDDNDILPSASPIIFANHSRSHMKWVQLLDFLRRPVSDQGLTVKPFLLMLFGALAVKVPSKMWVVENAGNNGSF